MSIPKNVLFSTAEEKPVSIKEETINKRSIEKKENYFDYFIKKERKKRNTNEWIGLFHGTRRLEEMLDYIYIPNCSEH